ncbi:hypothetical protein [Sulfitobacter sp. S190]|uniref:hypothetical protein n=1 Tax=Sulfitobacter sp. S190 TaxID=2867022 RepID=UPI0021A67515|nr:hypothetical protein [Sulfitobacter sp. S190]UWR23515.1 hypothetical protein K3756_05920 [Sulfitobacter sp. S190]
MTWGRRRAVLTMGAVAAGALAAVLAGREMRDRRRDRAARALYAQARVTPPTAPMRVYHLGHSLVGRDMPAMLAQLAGQGHSYASQLGWGTSLRQHWEPDAPINGFETENAHAQFMPARAAVGSGAFDAVILTEMVELRDALRYHDSAAYLARWAALAHEARPDTRLYLYETWHRTDDPDGWLARIDADLDALWLGKVAYPAAAATGRPIHVIPAGQVLAAIARAIAGQDGIGNLTTRDALFARTDDGTPDAIHLSDLGAYAVALTHYAVLYHRSPEGLPLALLRADGSAAQAPDAVAGAMMQRVVWDVVRRVQESGVAA